MPSSKKVLYKKEILIWFKTPLFKQSRLDLQKSEVAITGYKKISRQMSLNEKY